MNFRFRLQFFFFLLKDGTGTAPGNEAIPCVHVALKTAVQQDYGRHTENTH